MYAPIEYDRTKYIRCCRCGVLKKRAYAPPLTFDQIVEILALRQGGYGAHAIQTRTGINIQRVKRLLKKYHK